MSDPTPGFDPMNPDDVDPDILPEGDERDTDPGIEDAPVQDEGPSFEEHQRDVRDAVEQGDPDPLDRAL